MRRPPKPWRAACESCSDADVGLSVTGVAGPERARRPAAGHGLRRVSTRRAVWTHERRFACPATARAFAPTARSARSTSCAAPSSARCNEAALVVSTERRRHVDARLVDVDPRVAWTFARRASRASRRTSTRYVEDRRLRRLARHGVARRSAGLERQGRAPRPRDGASRSTTTRSGASTP